MQTNNILEADVLDIIFDGKNKSYGAYELRKTYNKRLITSVLIMSSVCLLLFLSTLFASDNDNGKLPLTGVIIKFENIKENIEPPVPPQEIPKQRTQVKTIIFTPPIITIDKDVAPEEAIKEISEIEHAAIGTATVDGVDGDGFVAPPLEVGTGVVIAPKIVKENFEEQFTRIEKEAMFPGGPEAWRKYLERNLNANVAGDDGAPTGSYTVKVQFLVDPNGNISNVIAIDIPKACPSCGPEAIKVIKRGPKWEPAIQNGRKVLYQAIQFITFQVLEE